MDGDCAALHILVGVGIMDHVGDLLRSEPLRSGKKFIKYERLKADSTIK